MIPTLSFYHLLLFALVWLFLLLYWLWPNDPAACGQATPTPTQAIALAIAPRTV